MTWALSILVTVMLLAILGLGLRFVENLERENRAIEEQLRSSRLYYEALAVRVREMQRFRHDVNGLLQAVEYASAFESCDGIIGLGNPTGERGARQLSILDAMLMAKRDECRDASISFSCEVSDGWRDFVRQRCLDENDVQAIAQNLLQNAFEASLKVEPASERVIEFRLEEQEGRLAVEVSNRIASAEMPSFKTIKPDNEEHGIGLQVIESILESHNGSKQVDFNPITRMLEIRVAL